MTIDIDKRIEELLKPSNGSAAPRRCDLLLFVAVRAELDAVLRVALENSLPVERVHGRESEYISLGTLGQRTVMVVKTSEGPFSHGGSASKAIHCVAETGATGLISVGMAFGAIPSLQKFGDVLVSTGVLAYDEAYVRSSKTTSSAHDYAKVPRLIPSPALLDECRATAELPEWKDSVHVGLILSGAARIYCSEFRDRLARKCEHGRGDLAVGGEMEGVGIASASSQEAPNWIIVKAICDFASHDRDKVIAQYRPVACRNAARFVLETISRKVTS